VDQARADQCDRQDGQFVEIRVENFSLENNSFWAVGLSKYHGFETYTPLGTFKEKANRK
jgi:hypothetical protein